MYRVIFLLKNEKEPAILFIRDGLLTRFISACIKSGTQVIKCEYIHKLNSK